MYGFVLPTCLVPLSIVKTVNQSIPYTQRLKELKPARFFFLRAFFSRSWASRNGTKSRKWVVVALNLFLILAIAHDILQLSDMFQTSAPLSVAVPPQVKNSVGAHGSPSPVRHAMPRDWHPFGRTVVASLVQQVPSIPETAPDTSLNLTLLGILYFAHPDSSAGLSSARALIKGPNLKERGFRVQDKLPGNVKIVAIYPNRVILKRKGKFETLRLPKKNIKL